jgi:REP element-mobilizing transposase RayT
MPGTVLDILHWRLYNNNMRRARFTYKGAYHHVMNRGIEGRQIFPDERARMHFLEILREKSETHRMRVFAYCIMTNHYHLVLQNSSGRLSDFMKQLNGQYGIYYRKRTGGKGYVFQSRFESTLIQDDAYMDMAIVYVLLNPVRAGLVGDPWRYKWSSIRDYFSTGRSTFLDVEFVDGLFGEEKVLRELLTEWAQKDLPIKKTRLGNVLGDADFIEKALRKFDRRKGEGESKRMRKYEFDVVPADKVIREFEKEKGVTAQGINARSKEGKTLRNELLVRLKDRAGLTYPQITQYPPFVSLKHSSLGQIYRREKERRRDRK